MFLETNNTINPGGNVTNPLTLQGHIDNLFELYGRRNAMYLRGEMRGLFLLEGLATFDSLLCAECTDRIVLGGALASVFSRTVAFADSFVDLPVVEAMCRKYAADRCCYCNERICICGKNRDRVKHQIKLAEVDQVQRDWTINQWVISLSQRYGKQNQAQGVFWMFTRLSGEIFEAMKAHLFEKPHDPSVRLSNRRANVAKEFADVFAWIFSFASVLDVDLEESLRRRYGGTCNRCGFRPCECGSPLSYDRRSNPIRGATADTVVG